MFRFFSSTVHILLIMAIIFIHRFCPAVHFCYTPFTKPFQLLLDCDRAERRRISTTRAGSEVHQPIAVISWPPLSVHASSLGSSKVQPPCPRVSPISTLI